MGSQTNHNAAYLYSVDGLTPWEKLRVIRNFLTQHQQNLKLSELNFEKATYKISQLDDSILSDFKRREFEITKAESLDVNQKCRNEIKFLIDLEKQLVQLTEPTRLEGKSDDEMYEINYYNELSTHIVRNCHADILTQGVISSNNMKELLRCPPALQVLSDQGILNLPEVNALLTYNDMVLQEPNIQLQHSNSGLALSSD